MPRRVPRRRPVSRVVVRVLGVALLPFASLAPSVRADDAPRPAYPPTRTSDVVDVLHGERVADPYRWLEDNASREVEAWDRAQRALLRQVLDAVPGREALRARLDAELDLQGAPTLPGFEGGRAWYLRRDAGQNHPVLYARDRDGAGPEVAVIDPNAWSADGTEGLSGYDPSPDGRWLCYGRDTKGSEDKTLYLRDLSTGRDTDLRLTRCKFSSVVWAPDASGFYYSRQPDPDSVPPGQAQHHRRVFFHPLGGLVLDDPRVYGTGRPPLESMYLGGTSDRSAVVLYRGEPYRTTDVFRLERTQDGFATTPVFVGVPALSWGDRVGDRWLLVTDWKAPRKRILTAPFAGETPPERWTEFLPEGPGVIESLDVAGDRVVVHVREDVVSSLRVFKADGTPDGEVPLPGPGSVRGTTTKPGDSRLWYGFESNARPYTTYVVDLATSPRAPQVLDTTPTTLDPDTLVAERLLMPSKDGTKIPLFVLRRKDVPLDGRAPTLLYGYGGFRVGQTPTWASLRALWAEMGGVYVTACLRGGDEYGEAWHEAGSLAHKQNVYDDFIACADGLVAAGKASRERLAIAGGSNGGLLVAVVANQRPDLCQAVLCSVPLTDMLRFHRFQFAKIWTKEYGDPDVEAEYRWIRPYSPVHNVRPGAAYPACLVTAGLHEGRVDAFHARKIAAAWQAATSSSRPVLLAIDRDSGHGAASRKQLKEDQLDRFAFLLSQLGREGMTIRAVDARPVRPQPPAVQPQPPTPPPALPPTPEGPGVVPGKGPGMGG